MKYSFIIPAFNEEYYIEKCIQHIKCVLSVLKVDYEIIVVCNHCSDNTMILASRAGAIVTKSEAPTIGGVRNAGARVSCGDTLVFIDADTLINLEVLLSINPEAIGGGALLRLNNQSRIGDWITDKWNAYCLREKIFTGSFVFCKKEIFDTIGGFPEFVYILEDVLFSKKLNNYAGTLGHITQLIRNRYTTSDRKLHLFSWFTHLSFWLHFWWDKEKVITSREACRIWYEPRRESTH